MGLIALGVVGLWMIFLCSLFRRRYQEDKTEVIKRIDCEACARSLKAMKWALASSFMNLNIKKLSMIKGHSALHSRDGLWEHMMQEQWIWLWKRNRRIKPHPERFQETEEEFDLVVTVEERVYDQVIEYLNSRVAQSCSPVHVVNLDIQDNHEEATLGAFLICEMCQAIEGLDDLENEIDLVIPKLEKKWSRNLLHSVAFY